MPNWVTDGNPDADIGANSFLGTRSPNDPLRIRTGSNVNPADAMIITPAPNATTTGNVGIGTLTPDSKLTVHDDGGDGSAGSRPAQIRIHGRTNPSNKLEIGYDTTGNFAVIGALTENVAWRNIILANNGGTVGIGTTIPGAGAKLTVAGGDITWGNNSRLGRDQGGSIELGGDSNTAGTGSPYIDFHFQGLTQDFNTRIINDADGQLTISAGTLRTLGNLSVQGDITLGAGHTFSAPGRLHISGAEVLYLLNNQGVIISRAWGGNGNLTADGTVTIGGKLGVFGQPADAGTDPATGVNPRGLAGGIHTWDVEAEGTLFSANDVLAGGNFTQVCDARAKTKVAKLSDVMEKLEAIRGVSFERIESRPSTIRSVQQRDIGVIAQEVETVFPELVRTHGEENHKTVNYSGLTGILIEAVKELKAQNEALRARFEALERA